MTLINTHRKCMVCKSTTTDLTQETCSCGSYMHLIGQCYQPKTFKGENKKTAPLTLAGSVLNLTRSRTIQTYA